MQRYAIYRQVSNTLPLSALDFFVVILDVLEVISKTQLVIWVYAPV